MVQKPSRAEAGENPSVGRHWLHERPVLVVLDGHPDGCSLLDHGKVARWWVEEGRFFEKLRDHVWIGVRGENGLFVRRADLAEILIFGRGDVAIGGEAAGQFVRPAAKKCLTFDLFQRKVIALGEVESF